VIPTDRRTLRDWDIFVEFFIRKFQSPEKEKHKKNSLGGTFQRYLLVNFFDVATVARIQMKI